MAELRSSPILIAALALGLAFGLGGRDTAGEIVRRWYNRTQAAAPRIQEAAQAAQQQTAERVVETQRQLGEQGNFGRR